MLGPLAKNVRYRDGNSDGNVVEYIYGQSKGRGKKAGCMATQMAQGRHFPGDPPADQLPDFCSDALHFHRAVI